MPLRLLAVVALLAWALPGRAHAHGRFPAAGQISHHPSDPDTIAVRTTFGILLTHDGGQSWGWICREILDIDLRDDPAIAVMADGSVLSASFDGLKRGVDRGCSWSYPEDALDRVVTIDQVRHPTDGATSFVLTSPGAAPNRVYVTRDSGATWTPTQDIAPGGWLSERIAVAPSDPDVIYASGAIPPTADSPRQTILYRTDDGGESWTALPFERQEGDRNILVLAVDPNDAARAFMRVNQEPDGDTPDRLVRTEDGGETWTEVLTLAKIGGFTFSPDGSQAWIGGPEPEGLWRSDDGGGSFEQLTEKLSIGCLAHADGALWACANNYADGFAVGRSEDGGDTFDPALVFAEHVTHVIDCPGSVVETCEPVFVDLETDLGLAMSGEFPDGGRYPDAGGPGGPDAGVAPGVDAGPSDGGGGGCGCRASRGSGAAPPVLVLVGLASLARRRRR